MNRLKVYAAARLERLRGSEPDAGKSDDLELAPDPDEVAEEDVLTASLHNLLPEDIDLKKKHADKKKKSGGAIVRRIVLVICCAIFVACSVYLIWSIADKRRGKTFYDNIANDFGDIFAQEETDSGAVARLKTLRSAQGVLCLKDRLSMGADYDSYLYSSDSRIDEMRAKLTSLAESFPDLYGWISIGGTAINYPLVQDPDDNNYYLNAAPDKTPLINGSIFVDYRNYKDIMRNFNTVMYGHNLQGGGMFHDVQAKFFENEEIFRNTLIYIYTMDGAYVYEPFAVYETRATYQYFRTEFATADEFVAFANEMSSNSIYKKEIEFLPTDRIITLSTCTNRNVDGRYALQAKLVQVIH